MSKSAGKKPKPKEKSDKTKADNFVVDNNVERLSLLLL